MNIDFCGIFRRVARIACLALVTGLLAGSMGMAQLPISFTPGNPPPVLGGSVIPFSHGASGNWGQIYSMALAPNGNLLFLDSQNSNIYQLAPGSSTPTLVVGPGSSPSGSNTCAYLESAASGGWWNGGIAFDTANNLYVTNRYSSVAEFCRIPYNAASNSWNFNANDAWNPTPSIVVSGTSTVLHPQVMVILPTSDPKTNTVYFTTSSGTLGIYEMSLDVPSGTWSNLTPIITNLEAVAATLAVDQAGNLYFTENIYPTPVASRITGIREIPAGQNNIVASGNGSEATVTNLIGASNNFTGIGGITLDAHGNLYFASANNPTYSGYVDGLFMIPNEGTPTVPNLNWADTVMVSPVKAEEQPLVDPRGFIWIATGQSSNWAPTGTVAPACDTTTAQSIAATCLTSNMVIWKPGMANLGSGTASGAAPAQVSAYSVVSGGGTLTLTANNSFTENQVVQFSVSDPNDPLYTLNGLSFYVLGSPLSSSQFSVSIPTTTGTAGYLPGSASGSSSATANLTPISAVYYSFNQSVTPASFNLGQGGSHFTVVPNPTPGNLPTGSSFTSVPSCTGGTTYPAWNANEEQTSNPPSDYSWCALYLQENTQGPGLVGSEAQMLDSTGKIISGSNVYLSAVGQGAAISSLETPATSSVASGLSTPKQVAVDSQGGTYVADAGKKAIEYYAAGTSGATSPTATYGSNLSSPTGVAVDQAGDLYIGDTGSVYEIPYIKGQLQTTQQTKIASGLGSQLNLAVDAWGDVIVADQANKQVVEIFNAQTALTQQSSQGMQVLGSGANFTGPSAVSTDNAGNVWVADGTNLWEIAMPFGWATEVTSTLTAPVTGLAIDPSGSVFVAEPNGVLWIPYQVTSSSAGLNVNSAVLMDSGLAWSSNASPTGVALDASENVYAAYGSGASAGLSQLNINGSIDYYEFMGQLINPAVPYEADVPVFNLGNSPLTLADFSTDIITQPNPGEITMAPATLASPGCSSSASIAPGGSCYIGFTLLDALTPPAGIGPTVATAPVASNAVNAPTLNVVLSADVEQDFRPSTSLAVTISPDTTTAACAGSVYPGCQTVTVTVSSTGTTPNQGTVTLKVPGSGASQATQTVDLSGSNVATFHLSNLSGGSYNVLATYGGAGTAGASVNTCSPAGSSCYAGSAWTGSFTVARATPTFTVGPPGTAGCLSYTATNCTPNAGIITPYLGTDFVNLGKDAWFTASVTAALGTPTGSVSFLVNGNPLDPTQPQNSLSANGIAEFSLTNLALGEYNVTAVYNGDQNYLSGSVTIPAFQVISPSVQITASPASVSTSAGTAVTATLNLMPLVGFSQDVSLKCIGTSLPEYTECTFAYPNAGAGTVTVGNNQLSTVVVTISSNVPVNSGAGSSSSSLAHQEPWTLAGLFGMGLLGVIAGRKRLNRYLTMVCLAVMISGLSMAVTSCTNAGYSTPLSAPKVTTPGGTYNVQIISFNQTSLQQNSLATPVFTLPVTIK